MSLAPAPQVNIERTFGALLVGAFIAIGFSGVVTTQTFVYYSLYKSDAIGLKLLVGWVWTLDVLHSAFICGTIWNHFIVHFGDAPRIDFIPWTLPVTIILTATLTFCVHLFFVHRIYRLTKNNLYICVPIAVLAFFRLCSAIACSTELLVLSHFSMFLHRFKWNFTLGLALSSSVDVLITSSLCYHLEASRTGSSSLNAVIDSLMLYTFENGLLTCIATIVSMVCWLTMPHNLIFMGIHFIIGKLYANSLLVTLNTRKEITRRKKSISSRNHGGLQVLTQGTFGGRGHARNHSTKSPPLEKKFEPLQVNVARTVEYDKQFIDTDGENGSRPSTARTLKFDTSDYNKYEEP